MNDYYELVNVNYTGLALKNSIEISSKEIDIIMSYIDSEIYIQHIGINYSFKTKKIGYNTITLFKIPDEWYFIYYFKSRSKNQDGQDLGGYTCYKCDQFDGLIKLIKDKLI